MLAIRQASTRVRRKDDKHEDAGVRSYHSATRGCSIEQFLVRTHGAQITAFVRARPREYVSTRHALPLSSNHYTRWIDSLIETFLKWRGHTRVPVTSGACTQFPSVFVA